MAAAEQRADCFRCGDADVILVASNTPARMVKGVIQTLRSRGVKAGLIRPITLWPFPIDAFLEVLPRAERLIVVEASNGQLEDELRLALSRAGIKDFPDIEHVRRMGGNLPEADEILELVLGARKVTP
jgi:pyruvate/2-oxoacid:ferredoxin oxidoreductase alpha subunit